MKNFAEILVQRIERDKINISSMARDSGVKKDLLYKLAKGERYSTTVEPAIKIAAYFGETLDEFMGGHRSDEEREIINLVLQLPADLRGKLLGYGERLLDEVDPVPPKSDEENQ